jgi:hypothetical protein
VAGGWQRLDTSGVTGARSEASRGGKDGRRVAEAGHQLSDSGEVRGQQSRKEWKEGYGTSRSAFASPLVSSFGNNT